MKIKKKEEVFLVEEKMDSFMKVEVTQRVKIEGDNFPYAWNKNYGDRNVIPHKGDRMEDPLWKDPYESST